MDNMIIANDNECADRRRSLIKAGIIKENVSGNSTRKYSTKLRKDLKRKGLISDKYIEIKTSKVRGNDEGFYKVRSISDDNDYQNRRNNYFRILQEILVSRRTLKLILGPKQKNDPGWIF